MVAQKAIEYLGGGLIVSCQALEDEPLHGAEIMARMAVAACEGGAVGIRANGPEDIRAIRAAVRVPIIGIFKQQEHPFEVYITPTYAAAAVVVEAGADIVAIDATQRERPRGETAGSLIRRIREELQVPVMADVATFEEAMQAFQAGADLVSTTLAGYTQDTIHMREPDYTLIHRLSTATPKPVVAEGHIWTPEQAVRALESGAYAVVVGSGITRPQLITHRFVEAIGQFASGKDCSYGK